MDKVTQGVRDLNVNESHSQRDENRKEKVIALKEEKEFSRSDQRKSFELIFSKNVNTILGGIKCIEDKKVDENELPKLVNSFKSDINSLRKHLAMSTSFLNNYTVRRSLQNLEKLENKIKELEATVLPKKKFGFKAQKKNDGRKPTKVLDEVDGSVNAENQVNSATVNVNLFSVFSGFSDMKNENLILCNDEIAKNDVELRNLDNCTVFLCGAPSTVFMSNITRCKILSGPVSTSIYIENCSDSDIVVACQQLRIHSTKHSRFYIHVTSRAIIEDTHNVQFAPYNLEYEELETHFENSGLNKSLNNWNTIDDFNWLVSGTHSPNWSLINSEERVPNWLSLINNQTFKHSL